MTRDTASTASKNLITYTTYANDGLCNLEVHVLIAKVVHVVDFDKLIHASWHLS